MKLIRIHILPRVKELYDQEDRKIVLGDEFDTYASSLAEYVELVKPSLLIEHELDGNSYGKIETIENTPKGVFAIASVDDPTVLKGKRFVSPRIRWNHTDIHGRRWPAALLETSLVSVPRFMIGQQEIESINSMTYSNVVVEDAKLSEVNLEGLQLPIEEIEQVPDTQPKPEETMLTPEMIEQIKTLIKEAMLEAEAAEEAAEVAVPAETAAAEDMTIEAPAADVAVTATPTMPASSESAMEEVVEVVDLEEVEQTVPSTMAQKISRMSQESKDELLVKLAEALYEAKKETVMSAIRNDLQVRGISSAKADDFYKVYMANKAAYESTMSAFGKPATKIPATRPTRTSPVTDSVMSGVGSASGNMSPAERALADSKAGKGSFQELLSKYRG